MITNVSLSGAYVGEVQSRGLVTSEKPRDGSMLSHQFFFFDEQKRTIVGEQEKCLQFLMLIVSIESRSDRGAVYKGST